MKVNASNRYLPRLFPSHGPSIRTEISKKQNLIELAKKESFWNNWSEANAKEFRKALTLKCNEPNLDIGSITKFKADEDISILMACIVYEEWESCRIIMHALPYGHYSDQSILHREGVNGEPELILTKQGKQKGILLYRHGGYKAGDMEGDKLNGKGIIKTPTWVYKGDFVDGKEEGQGTTIFDDTEGKFVMRGHYKDGDFVPGRFSVVSSVFQYTLNLLFNRGTVIETNNQSELILSGAVKLPVLGDKADRGRGATINRGKEIALNPPSPSHTFESYFSLRNTSSKLSEDSIGTWSDAQRRGQEKPMSDPGIN